MLGLLLVLLFSFAQKEIAATNITENYGLDMYRLLRKYNYSVETHWVQTEDNYILRMQHVARRYGTLSDSRGKPAVLLMHGLLSSAADWVNMGPDKSLALALADAGFDVWLGNNRGTTWSRQHVTLDPDSDAAFWDYSFETCGYYDLPAKIDYIIEQTGQKKIFYVGHSQGTSQFFAMAALRPEYNDKIVLMSALAPVVYMKHLASPIPRLMSKYMSLFKVFMGLLNIHELLPHSKLLTDTAIVLCSNGSKFQEVCAQIIFELGGYNSPQLDRAAIPVIASNAPAGISLKMLLHYGQEIQSGYFRRYDYGALNIKHYKSLEPPLFDISAITAPVALYYSLNDYFAAIKDVERLARELPNVVKKRLIEDKKFNHLDYIWGKDANEIINKDLVAHMKQFVSESSGANSNFNQLQIVLTSVIFVIITRYF